METPYKKTTGKKRLKAFFVFTLFLVNSAIFSDQEAKTLFSPEIENEMLISLQQGSDRELITLLENTKEIPVSFWVKVLQAASDPYRTILREYVINKFEKNPPYSYDVEKLRVAYLKVLKFELEKFLSERHHMPEQIRRVKKVLANVEAWRFKELFYQSSVLIGYPVLDVRHAASKAVAAIRDDRIYPILLKLANSPNPVERTYAVDALYYIQDNRTVPILIGLINDENKSVRYYVIKALEKMDIEAAIPYYIKMVRADSNDEVRVAAIKALAAFRSVSGYSVVLETVSDPNPKIREAVIEALFLYNNVSSAYLVSKQLTEESIDELKIREIGLLIKLQDDGKNGALAEVLEKEKNEKVLLWAIYATGVLQDLRGYDTLLGLTTNPSKEIRVETIYALSGFASKKPSIDLISILRQGDQPYEVETAIINSLALLDDSDIIVDLLEIIDTHKDRYIVEYARKTLHDMLARRHKSR